MNDQPHTPDEQHLPAPDSEPVEPEPKPVKQSVHVPCAGCGRTYEFEIAPSTATFTFECRACKTRTEWVRSD